MEYKTVTGIIVPLVTPFKHDGQINFGALDELNDFLIRKGVHGLFPCGSTGEGAFLNNEERKAVALHTVHRADSRIPVIVQTGTIRPADAIELTKHARDIGAAGAGLTPPYYFNMDNACIYEYYRSVAQSVPDFPIYLYNIPPNVKNVITPEVLARLMNDFPNIVGIKDSSGDFMNFINFQQAAPKRLCALMGNDAQIYSGLLIGASGAIAATANPFPEVAVAIYNNWLRGDPAKALEAQDKIIKMRAILRSFTPIAPYKKILEWQGLKVGIPRLPLRDLTLTEEVKLRDSINELGYTF